MKKTIHKDKNRNELGRFVKGSKPNPTGANGYTTIIPLINALKKAGKKRGENFWDMVANRMWTSDTVLVACLKKILPDQIEHSGEIAQRNLFFIEIIKKSAEIGDRLDIRNGDYTAR